LVHTTYSLGMAILKLTLEQARRFLARKQGLLGKPRFSGKTGVLEYVKQAGCIQFDPVDVCGKNAEIVLQSRVAGFDKAHLSSLLYKERRLVDYFDKNLAIWAVEDWPFFERIRQRYRLALRGHESVEPVLESVRHLLCERGPLCSKDIELHDKVDWYWSTTRLARATLETLYFRGEAVVHHKKNTVKYYALAGDCLPKAVLEAADPHVEELDFLAWRVRRRIGAVGLLWNRASDAWLFIDGLKASQREAVFTKLLADAAIMPLMVDGLKAALYCLTEDVPLLEASLVERGWQPRVELLAPLDGFLWDRKLLKALFDFDYTWEIYTPAERRRYSQYTLPVFQSAGFIGRAEIMADRKQGRLRVMHYWPENGLSPKDEERAVLIDCFDRFRRFHGLAELDLPAGF